jgi:hypothetical protein
MEPAQDEVETIGDAENSAGPGSRMTEARDI